MNLDLIYSLYYEKEDINKVKQNIEGFFAEISDIKSTSVISIENKELLIGLACEMIALHISIYGINKSKEFIQSREFWFNQKLETNKSINTLVNEIQFDYLLFLTKRKKCISIKNIALLLSKINK